MESPSVTLTLKKHTQTAGYAANPWVLVAGAESNLVYRVYWRGLLLPFFSWPLCFFNKAEVVTISTTWGSQKISMLTRKGCKWWQAYMQPPEKVDGIGLKDTFKKKPTFRSHLFSPWLPLSCSCFCWSLTRPLPRKSQGAPVKRSWKQLGRKVLGAASFVRNIETPGSLQNVGHLAMIQNIHQITNKFMYSLISYGMTPATLICNAGTLVLIWWKRMERGIIPFWVNRCW